jgi:FAD/FMN-containing dehydrogenase
MLGAGFVGKDGPMPDLARDLAAVVGETNVLVEPDLRAPFETDWTGRFHGPALMVVRPGATDEVAEVVRRAADEGVPIVVQGGNTGLVGGGVPAPGVAPLLLSTVRLTRLDQVDTAAGQLTVGAGVTLGRLQEAADRAGWTFPVDLAARDSATVGGMVATNAGGLKVVRYGPMRSQVLGVEAVLANGTVISRLGGLMKDNTGYDLSQLLVGSEGTLGIVTAVRIRLAPSQPEKVVALLGLPATADCVEVAAAMRRRVEGLEAAELFFQDGLDLVVRHAGLPAPMSREWPAYLLVECAGAADPSEGLFELLADLDLPEAATAVATDPAGRQRLWAYRERHTEAIASLGVPHKLDVSVPLDALADFERRVHGVVSGAAPAATLVLFGHIGDGNLHVNVVGPPDDNETVDDSVLRLVADMGGSISAEHGVGRAKARWLSLSRTESELAVMRAVKTALDPSGRFNPGVLLGDW